MPKLLHCTLYIAFLFIALPLSSKAGTMPDLRKWGPSWEEYDSTLFYRLQNIDDIISYADSVEGSDQRQTLSYCEILASTIRKRFYHIGYSYYSLEDNWIAWLAGNLIWDHLHAIVLPDDILKHPGAACSQQAIVLKDCFKRAGIDYREVNLKGHFVLEGKIEGQWHLFDTNLEPSFPKGRKALDALLRSRELAQAYKHALTPSQVEKIFAHPVYGEPNAPIAPNATFFQRTTGFLSLTLPILLPLGLFLYLLARKRRRKEEEPEGVKFVEVEEKVTADYQATTD